MDRIILFSIPGKKSFSDRFTETARVYLRSPPHSCFRHRPILLFPIYLNQNNHYSNTVLSAFCTFDLTTTPPPIHKRFFSDGGPFKGRFFYCFASPFFPV